MWSYITCRQQNGRQVTVMNHARKRNDASKVIAPRVQPPTFKRPPRLLTTSSHKSCLDLKSTSIEPRHCREDGAHGVYSKTIVPPCNLPSHPFVKIYVSMQALRAIFMYVHATRFVFLIRSLTLLGIGGHQHKRRQICMCVHL